MTVTLATFMEVLDSSTPTWPLPAHRRRPGATQTRHLGPDRCISLPNAIILPAGA